MKLHEILMGGAIIVGVVLAQFFDLIPAIVIGVSVAFAARSSKTCESDG